MATNILSRAVLTAVQFIQVPITLSYLGANAYGLWSTITAFVGMAAFADLGINAGLMTKLAVCYSEGRMARARSYITSAYATLSAVAMLFISGLWLAADYVPWSSLFNVTDSVTAGEARAISFVCIVTFLCNLPISLIIRVEYACQRVSESNMWQAAGSLLSLPLVLLAVHARMPPVVVIAAAVGTPVLVSVANNIQFYWRMLDLRPRVRLIEKSAARELFSLSLVFFVLASVLSVAQNSDPFLIAHTLGLSSVTAYAVPAKAFTLLALVVSLLNMPAWPSYSEAISRGDTRWVARTTRRLTVLTVGIVLGVTLAMVTFGKQAIRLWVGQAATTDRILLAGFGIWALLSAALSPVSIVQDAAGRIRPQLIGWSVYVVVSIPVKWYVAARLGSVWLPYIASVVYSLAVAPATILGYRAVLRDAAGTAEVSAGRGCRRPGRGPRPLVGGGIDHRQAFSAGPQVDQVHGDQAVDGSDVPGIGSPSPVQHR